MGDVLEEVLPFDLGRAHRLYKELLAPLERLISGKQLLIVPSGPLATLPLQVMLTEEPKTTIPQSLLEYRQAAWLGSRQPMIMLPTVASLKALREIAKPSKAPKPYLGIGNPLLDGPHSDPKWGGYYKQQAKLAREKRCPAHSSDLKIASTGGRKPLDGFDRLWRGTHADLAQLRLQTPLPETADELCEIARGLGVSQNDILLGEAATEAKVKDLSEQGRLADYAILHFATHGALGGEVLGSAEPGLILTPPAKADANSTALDRDDGFLTSSEIASLKLDADWVILSACNTAAGQNQTSEALSGMARAFFYAGARGLLVSHWAVSSGAAVKLTTRAFDELRTKPDIARAEAFRVSIRELIQNGNTFDAHPSQWAPFVLVGTGAH